MLHREGVVSMSDSTKRKANYKPLTVLSLCDGMSCGQIALTKLGVPIKAYYASEIKPHAIKVTQANYPNTIQIGDVTFVTYNAETRTLNTANGVFKVVDGIDLVIFGSPCQTFSGAMTAEHRVGMSDPKKSGLFLECYRILQEVKPKYFLMENVAGMRDTDRDTITAMLGVMPIFIDSKDFSPAYRKRYYWTNIPQCNTEHVPPVPTNSLQDILTDGYVPNKKAYCLLVSHSRPNTTPVKLFYRSYKRKFINVVYTSEEHFNACKAFYDSKIKDVKATDIPLDIEGIGVFDGIRVLNQEEFERCQTVPVGYTNCLTYAEAADVLGDGGR